MWDATKADSSNIAGNTISATNKRTNYIQKFAQPKFPFRGTGASFGPQRLHRVRQRCLDWLKAYGRQCDGNNGNKREYKKCPLQANSESIALQPFRGGQPRNWNGYYECDHQQDGKFTEQQPQNIANRGPQNFPDADLFCSL